MFCKLTYVFALGKGSQLEPLCIHMLTTLYIYTYHITKLTYVYALASAKTLWNLLIYMHILTSIYIYHIRDTFVDEPMLKKTHICLCPCECSHLELLDIHAILTIIHICHNTDTFCIWTSVLRTHIWLCPCECLHLEPLFYILMYSSKGLTNFYYIIGTFIYEPVLCKLTYMCALASAQTKILWPGHARTMDCDKSFPSSNLRLFLPHIYVYSIYAYIFIYICIYWFFVHMCVWVLNLRWDILVLVVFSKMFNLTLGILC